MGPYGGDITPLLPFIAPLAAIAVIFVAIKIGARNDKIIAAGLKAGVVCVLLALGGCLGAGGFADFMAEATEAAGKVSDKTLSGAAKAIDRYCGVPPVARIKLRREINDRTRVGDIVVACHEAPAP